MKLESTSRILCIDPGTEESGVVIFDGKDISYINSRFNNKALVEFCRLCQNDSIPGEMVIEGISSYGMPVGETTFETVEYIGRFREAFGFKNTHRIYRKDVKMFLCGTMRAKDAHIRQRILDIFPATGGGKNPQIGVKGNKGPLFGVTSHAMSALAVGLCYKYNLAKNKGE